MEHKDSLAKYQVSLLTANILFGLNYSFYHSIIGHILTSNQLFFVRIAFSALCFVPLMFIMGKWRIDLKDFYKFAFIGIMIIFGRMFLMLYGMNFTSPIDGSIIATMNPILIMIFSAILLKEQITRKRVFGILLGAVGAVFLIISDAGGGIHGGKMLGNILLLVSILFSAFNTVFIKEFILKYHPFTIIGWAMLAGIVLVVPIFWHDMIKIDVSRWNSEAWFELGYITVFGTFLATAMAYYPLKKVSATVASMFAYAQPVAATILAVWRGQDKITDVTIISSVLIFLGVFMVIRSYKTTGNAGPTTGSVTHDAKTGTEKRA